MVGENRWVKMRVWKCVGGNMWVKSNGWIWIGVLAWWEYLWVRMVGEKRWVKVGGWKSVGENAGSNNSVKGGCLPLQLKGSIRQWSHVHNPPGFFWCVGECHDPRNDPFMWLMMTSCAYVINHTNPTILLHLWSSESPRYIYVCDSTFSFPPS